MKKTRSSLRGQNRGSLPKCVGSSPTSSTISKQKLWEKLRGLDRRLSNLPKQLIFNHLNNKIEWVYDKNSKLYIKLDQERKMIRSELKRYERNN